MPTPYLMFNGRCEEALTFYAKALDAKIDMLMRFKDNPETPPPGCTPADANKIMHASFSVNGRPRWPPMEWTRRRRNSKALPCP